jgi:DNA-binding beta-propeller fold protein YncE
VIEYRTLSVRIEVLHGDRYKAIVRGLDGDGQVEFELPFDGGDFDEVASAVSRPRSARRRIESDESVQAREFGERLFELIFRETARDVLRASFAQARRENHGLRLMLQLEGAPQLRNVPWELLCDSTRFISTSAYTPVLRYVDMPSRPPPLSLRPPLRILGMVSSPGDMPALDAERERGHLEQACRSLTDKGLLEIDWVAEASLAGLLKYLNEGDYHIFHFIGHGDFDEQAEDGVLLFEGRAGRSHRVTGVDLGTILADQHTLRLAVINACEGARVALDSNGIASSLMRYGLPAVIAMQFEISDEAAIGFAQHFYEAVARSHPIDEALADARRGMFADGHGLEWATPVLFTSVDDSRLFDVGWEKLGTEELKHRSRKKRAGGSGEKHKPRLTPRTVGLATAALTAITVLVLVLAGAFAGHAGSGVGQPITVAQTPVGITASAERVWVTDRERGLVSSIDPRTHKIDDRVSIPGKPNAVAVDTNGYVWVVSFESGKVTVFDPRSHNRILNQYTVGREPNTIAIGFGSAWVANSGDETVSRIGLGSASNHSSGAMPTISEVGRPSGIAVGLGSVWVANSRGTVARIDPSDEGVKEIPIGHRVSGIAVGDGSVWVTSPGQDSVSRISPEEEAHVVAKIPVGHEPKGIAVSSSGVWVANKGSGTVSQIVPGAKEQRPREIELEREAEPNAIAIEGESSPTATGPHTVWVTRLDNNTVTPIEP